MAMTVKKIQLWRREAPDMPGVAASTLAPLAQAGSDLKLVMGYRISEGRAAVEVWPVAGQKAKKAGQSAGLSPTTIPAILVQGDDRPGLGHAFAQAIGDAGISLAFLVAHVIGRKYAAVFGFKSEADQKAAVGLLRKAGTPPRKRR